MRGLAACFVLVLVVTSGCATSTADGDSAQGVAGSDAAGGSTTGDTTNGGPVNTGGAAHTGGAATTGEANPGGAPGSGGTLSSGGTPNTGANTGGSGGRAAGGTGGTGGTTSDGGAPSTGCTGTVVSNPSSTPPSLTAGQWKSITPPGICQGAHYGCMDIRVNPCNTAVLYLSSDMEGMWKSEDAGATWRRIGTLTKLQSYCTAPQLDSPGDMQINPADPKQMYYVGGVRGCTMGFWVSNDGGETWSQPAGFSSQANNSMGGWTNDVYDVKADPADFKHVLLTFHSGFEWTGDAGVLESKDGGNSWTRHWPRGWGGGHSVSFLRDSRTWLVGTQTNGYWRTSDGGGNWSQVSTRDMLHGGSDAFYSNMGVLYVGALTNALRSTDNGLSFTTVAPSGDGYYAIIGDGKRLYTQLGNTGSRGGTPQPYVTSDESDGMTWTNYNSQTFSDGPYRMTFDPINRIIYSANWNAGVWALKVQ
jgi:hypothetical protein